MKLPAGAGCPFLPQQSGQHRALACGQDPTRSYTIVLGRPGPAWLLPAPARVRASRPPADRPGATRTRRPEFPSPPPRLENLILLHVYITIFRSLLGCATYTVARICRNHAASSSRGVADRFGIKACSPMPFELGSGLVARPGRGEPASGKAEPSLSTNDGFQNKLATSQWLAWVYLG